VQKKKKNQVLQNDFPVVSYMHSFFRVQIHWLLHHVFHFNTCCTRQKKCNSSIYNNLAKKLQLANILIQPFPFLRHYRKKY